MENEHVEAVVHIRTPGENMPNNENNVLSLNQSILNQLKKSVNEHISRKSHESGRPDETFCRHASFKDAEEGSASNNHFGEDKLLSSAFIKCTDFKPAPKPILKKTQKDTAIEMYPLEMATKNRKGCDYNNWDKIHTISETCEENNLCRTFQLRYMRERGLQEIKGKNQCEIIHFLDWKNKPNLEEQLDEQSDDNTAMHEHCYTSEVDARNQFNDDEDVDDYEWRFSRSRDKDNWRWSSRRLLKKQQKAGQPATNKEDPLWPGGSEDEEEDDNDNTCVRGPSLVIDPSTPFHYRWLWLVTVAVLYNVIFVIGRSVFWELNNAVPYLWYTLDYTADGIYILDTLFHAHEGYLDQGLMVRNSRKLRKNYFYSATWRTDILSCLPTDIVYFALPSHDKCHSTNLPCPVIFRVNRLFRIPRMMEFFDKTETRTGCPNVFRICKVVFSILVLIHWNSCFYFAISAFVGFGTDKWVYNLTETAHAGLLRQYIYCFYWSTLTLTTIGETPQPEEDIEYVFVVADFLAGVLIFATIVGNIGSMITNMNVARVEFQNRMDSVKQYLAFRRVSKELEERVIKWFAYTRANKQALDEERVLSALPDKLKAEIAIHVHLDTLKKVRIFQDCEPGLLEELVLKLRLQVFSPGDYICRKGDVGKEMYIVKRGRLSVVADDEQTVVATLSAGSVFGEVSVLDIPGNKTGNRRTANVRSIGYSDLFCLSKKDLWDTLADYPEARQSLMGRGCQLLRKDRLLNEEIFLNAQINKGPINERVDQIDDKITSFQHQLNSMLEEHSRQQKLLKDRIARLEKRKQISDTNQGTPSPIRRKYISGSLTSVRIEESSPGGSGDTDSIAAARYANFGRRSFHITPKSRWTRRKHRPPNMII